MPGTETTAGAPTPNVTLRAVASDDLPVFFEHQRDPAAVHMAAFRTREREAFMAHWAKILAAPSGDNRTILSDGRVAGNIGAWTDGSERLVGYWIGREFWGRGVATAALGLFLREIPRRPLIARVARHNHGSIRVLQKNGFIAIGAERFTGPDGQPGQELVFSLSTPPSAYASPACSMPEIRD